MLQRNGFTGIVNCNECQKRRLMSIIWKMECSHIVRPSPNCNHYHHSEEKTGQDLSVDPGYRVTNDAAKSTSLRHVAYCIFFIKKEKCHSNAPDGATVVLRQAEWCEQTYGANDRRVVDEGKMEAAVRFSRKIGLLWRHLGGAHPAFWRTSLGHRRSHAVPSFVRCYTFAVGGAGGEGGAGGDVVGGAQRNASCFHPASPSCNENKRIN